VRKQTLTFIDFMIKNGAERFIEHARDRLHKIRALQDYNFYEDSVDKGSGVREKSKQIIELLGNNEHIRSEREKARALRNKFVGIDSRNAGGGSYGGSSYGGGGSDSYSSGGVGGGGRYDSYDSGSRYAGQGSDSYSGGGGGGGHQQSVNNNYNSNYNGSNNHNNYNNSGGRYGGGSYDSSRPTRYDDEAPVEPEPEFEEAKVVPPKTSSSSSAAAATTSGGKLKVSIKKSATTPAKVPVVDLMPVDDIDLMGGFDTPAAPTDFDPFGMSAPAAAPVAAPVTAAASHFDPFGSAAYGQPPPQQPAPFDPFSAAPVNNFAANFAGFPPAPAPQAFQSSFVSPAAPAFTPGQYSGNQMNAFQQQQQHLQQPAMTYSVQPAFVPQSVQAPPPQQQQLYQNHSQDADFGDFEAAPQMQSNRSTAANAAKWGDLGKLVDLGQLEKNEAAQPKQAAKSSVVSGYDSFAGLDGFSKTPQSMVSDRLHCCFEKLTDFLSLTLSCL
jgi:hypothetical protein